MAILLYKFLLLQTVLSEFICILIIEPIYWVFFYMWPAEICRSGTWSAEYWDPWNHCRSFV